MDRQSRILGLRLDRGAALGSALGSIAALALGAAPARAADPCTTAVCFTPMAQSAMIGGFTVSSTGVYQPVSIYYVGNGVFDVAVAWPLLPVPVTVTAGQPLPNAAPINLMTALNASNKNARFPGFGGKYGGAGDGWMFAAGANLAAATLNVTAYQVTAGGPKIVGIAGSAPGGDQNAPANAVSLGFGVQVANAPTPPMGTSLHWVQVVADNYPATGAPGNQVYGNMEDVVDINSSNKTPYYDQGGGEIATANTLNFFDAPQRDNASEVNQSDWWLAQLFLAYGPANNMPGTVTLYNTGVEWGWANFHINVAGALNLLQALRNAFAFDTSSMMNFDLALDCDPADCPLNAFVTNDSLDQLYADFLAAPLPVVPEPQTWALALIGFAGLGLLGLRRRRIGIA